MSRRDRTSKKPRAHDRRKGPMPVTSRGPSALEQAPSALKARIQRAAERIRAQSLEWRLKGYSPNTLAALVSHKDALPGIAPRAAEMGGLLDDGTIVCTAPREFVAPLLATLSRQLVEHVARNPEDQGALWVVGYDGSNALAVLMHAEPEDELSHAALEEARPAIMDRVRAAVAKGLAVGEFVVTIIDEMIGVVGRTELLAHTKPSDSNPVRRLVRSPLLQLERPSPMGMVWVAYLPGGEGPALVKAMALPEDIPDPRMDARLQAPEHPLNAKGGDA